MGGIRAIETRYKGCRFRSRLEARWAVFFDAMGIAWEYEKEGYRLNLGDWYGNPPTGVTLTGEQFYLPDFWLPQVKMHAEVKAGWPSPNELALAGALADASGPAEGDHEQFPWPNAPVLILDGVPSHRMYWAAHGLEFEHGGWDLALWEYDLTDCHQYWLTEGRFYSEGGEWLSGPDWAEPYHSDSADKDCRGVLAARSARFEHGESGAAPPARQTAHYYKKLLADCCVRIALSTREAPAVCLEESCRDLRRAVAVGGITRQEVCEELARALRRRGMSKKQAVEEVEIWMDLSRGGLP